MVLLQRLKQWVKKSKGQSVCMFLFLFEKSMILQWQGDIASLRWIQWSKMCSHILLCFTVHHFKSLKKQWKCRQCSYTLAYTLLLHVFYFEDTQIGEKLNMKFRFYSDVRVMRTFSDNKWTYRLWYIMWNIFSSCASFYLAKKSLMTSVFIKLSLLM